MFHLNIIFKNHVHVHVYENTLLVSARFGLAMILEGESSGSNIIPAKFSVKMFLGHYQVLTIISLKLKCTLQENQKIQTKQLVNKLPEKKNIFVTYISTAGKFRVMLPKTWSPYFKYPRNPMAM